MPTVNPPGKSALKMQDIDDALIAWIDEAYKTGRREHLKK